MKLGKCLARIWIGKVLNRIRHTVNSTGGVLAAESGGPPAQPAHLPLKGILHTYIIASFLQCSSAFSHFMISRISTMHTLNKMQRLVDERISSTVVLLCN